MTCSADCGLSRWAWPKPAHGATRSSTSSSTDGFRRLPVRRVTSHVMSPRRHLTKLYLDSVGAADVKQVRSVFGWSRHELEQALQGVEHAGHALRLGDGRWATARLWPHRPRRRGAADSAPGHWDQRFHAHRPNVACIVRQEYRRWTPIGQSGLSRAPCSRSASARVSSLPAHAAGRIPRRPCRRAVQRR